MSFKIHNNPQIKYSLYCWIINSNPLINYIILITFILGALSLEPTVFMLAVYDKVLTSKNITTLMMLMGFGIPPIQ